MTCQNMIIQKKSLLVKIKKYLYRLFLLINLGIQLMFIMYQLKIGINQDKYECIVKNGDMYPYFYEGRNSLPWKHNVSREFNKILRLCIILYMVFDAYILIQVMKFFGVQVIANPIKLYCVSWSLLIGYLGIGAHILREAMVLRVTEAGQVCFGDKSLD